MEIILLFFNFCTSNKSNVYQMGQSIESNIGQQTGSEERTQVFQSNLTSPTSHLCNPGSVTPLCFLVPSTEKNGANTANLMGLARGR